MGSSQRSIIWDVYINIPKLRLFCQAYKKRRKERRKYSIWQDFLKTNIYDKNHILNFIIVIRTFFGYLNCAELVHPVHT